MPQILVVVNKLAEWERKKIDARFLSELSEVEKKVDSIGVRANSSYLKR